jgi:hypothetical protein
MQSRRRTSFNPSQFPPTRSFKPCRTINGADQPRPTSRKSLQVRDLNVGQAVNSGEGGADEAVTLWF